MYAPKTMRKVAMDTTNLCLLIIPYLFAIFISYEKWMQSLKCPFMTRKHAVLE